MKHHDGDDEEEIDRGPNIRFPRTPIPEKHAAEEEMREANRMFIAHFQKRAKLEKYLPWLQLLVPVFLCLAVFYFGTNESLRAQAKDILAMQNYQARQDGLITSNATRLAALETSAAAGLQAAKQADTIVQELRQEHRAWNAQVNAMDKEITELRGMIRELQNRKP